MRLEFVFTIVHAGRQATKTKSTWRHSIVVAIMLWAAVEAVSRPGAKFRFSISY